MRLLFEMDKRDYDNCTHGFVRNSAEPKASAPLVQYDTIPTAKRRYFKRGGSGEALIRSSFTQANIRSEREVTKCHF